MINNLMLLWDYPVTLVQLTLDGILLGAIFVLAAYGLALVWGVMNIINVAQGEFVMLGGFVTFYIYERLGLNPLWGIPASGVVMLFVGWTLYRIVIFRIVERDFFVSLLATFGLSILIQQFSNQVFGADIRTAEANLETLYLFDGLVAISWIKVVAFFAAITLGLILYFFMKKSKLGQAIRATAQNPRAAGILGIDTDRIYASTFAINAAICGIGGSLIAMTLIIHPFIGLSHTIRSFMIVVVAGLGNMLGVIFAGLGLGELEIYSGFILGAEYQNGVIFIALVVILVWRNFRLGRKRLYLK